MSRFITILVFLAAFVSEHSLSETKYYCDCSTYSSSECVVGSDDFSGASINVPKQSFSALQEDIASGSPGDKFLLCRGGSFTADQGLVLSKQSRSNSIEVSDYFAGWATEELSRPIVLVNSTSTIWEMDDGDESTQDGGYVFRDVDYLCTNVEQGCGILLRRVMQ